MIAFLVLTIRYFIHIIICLAILSIVIIFHEMGHYLRLKKLLPEEKDIFIRGGKFSDSFKGIRVGEQKHYDLLTEKEKLSVLNVGVLCGLIPILLTININSLDAFVVYCVYIFLSWNDLKRIILYLKKGTK